MGQCRVCMSNSFHIRPVAHSEVLNQLRTIRSDCSTGTDQTPVKYLKMAADYIASPLTYIINGFIANHSFPDVWKTARVSPIPNVASPTELDHYRPIAILPALSKVYERLIPNQIVKYIDQHNVLNENVLICPLTGKRRYIKGYEKRRNYSYCCIRQLLEGV